MEENITKDLLHTLNGRSDLTGMRFGKLKVIGKTNILPSEGRKYKRKFLWECLCDCGNTRKLRQEHLTSGACVTCGCSRREKGVKNRTWKGCGELPGHYLCHIRNRAKSFNREFNVSAEFLWNLYLSQGRKCAYSGLDIMFMPQRSGRSTASLDRIFSEYGYIEGNVQWVHRDINLMKNKFRPEIFHLYCTLVAEHKGLSYAPLHLPS